MGRLLAGIAAVAIGLLATPGLAQEKLTIWWAKGAYQAEDDALLAVVRKFEARSGVKVDLTWHAAPEMIPKLTAAVDTGAPPDITYADAFNLQAAGRWAFKGKLEDISDVMGPIKDRFAPNAAEAAWLANGKTGKRAYYAFPLKQQTLHIQYWKDILAAAGFKENDIPYTWQEYWAFWCDKVQPGLARGGRPRGVRRRQSDGHRVDELPQVIPALGRRLRRQAGRRRGQDPGRRCQGAARAHRRAQGLCRSLCEGLHAAAVDRMEGWLAAREAGGAGAQPRRRHRRRDRRARCSVSTRAPTPTRSASARACGSARPRPDGKPRFVLDIEPVSGTVTVGPAGAAGGAPAQRHQAALVRHRARDASRGRSSSGRTATSTGPGCVTTGDAVEIELLDPAYGIAPGPGRGHLRRHPRGRVGDDRGHRTSARHDVLRPASGRCPATTSLPSTTPSGSSSRSCPTCPTCPSCPAAG